MEMEKSTEVSVTVNQLNIMSDLDSAEVTSRFYNKCNEIRR